MWISKVDQCIFGCDFRARWRWVKFEMAVPECALTENGNSDSWWIHWRSWTGDTDNRLLKSNGGGGGGGLVTSQTCLDSLRSVLSLWHRSSAFLSLRLRTLMFSTHSENSSLLITLLDSSLPDTMLVNSWKLVNYFEDWFEWKVPWNKVWFQCFIRLCFVWEVYF